MLRTVMRLARGVVGARADPMPELPSESRAPLAGEAFSREAPGPSSRVTRSVPRGSPASSAVEARRAAIAGPSQGGGELSRSLRQLAKVLGEHLHPELSRRLRSAAEDA